MTAERFKMFVAVHVFLIQDDKILLIRRFNTGYEDGKFSVPAGHVDGNEAITTAAIRETKEEVGLIIPPRNLQFIEVMYRHGHRESIDFFFVCTKWKGNPFIAEPEKCDRIQWTSLNRLPANTIMYIRSAIAGYLHQAPFLEVDY